MAGRRLCRPTASRATIFRLCFEYIPTNRWELSTGRDSGSSFSCKAAISLEKKPYLGGLAAEISKIPDKKRLADFPNYMIHRTNNLKNLFAFTNTDANVDFIKNLKPNIIVNATGSSPLLQIGRAHV